MLVLLAFVCFERASHESIAAGAGAGAAGAGAAGAADIVSAPISCGGVSFAHENLGKLGLEDGHGSQARSANSPYIST